MFDFLLTPLSRRYTRAERELKQARPFGEGSTKFYDVAAIEPPTENPKELIVAVTSDRGKRNLPNWTLFFINSICFFFFGFHLDWCQLK